MFWKSKTPKEKLTEEIANMYQSTIKLALRESSESFMQATYMRMAIITCNDTARSHAPRLARKYNMALEDVWRVISDCHDAANKYFLE